MAHSTLDFLTKSAEFTDLGASGAYAIDLRYATDDNFLGRNLYGEFNRAFLHREAAEKLGVASENLRRLHPRYRFVVFDALRPRSIQRILWAAVVGTTSQPFIADPELGSLHNFGFAVDLSIVDGDGRELDMGAGFDEFTERAQPRFEAQSLARGEVTPSQLANRHLLRDVMHAAGFRQLPHEWWHFDALTRDVARRDYVIVE